MRVVKAMDMQAIDLYTSKEIGIDTSILMENAGRAVADIVEELLENPYQKKIVVFAGKGNNGGDGYVAARWLYNKGAFVTICSIVEREDLIGVTAQQFDICCKMGMEIIALNDDSNLSEIKCKVREAEVVIDALLGTGFQGLLQDDYKKYCQMMTNSLASIVAIDVPSGVEADTGQATDAVQADITVTLGLLKPGLLLHPGAKLSGEIVIADIGIPMIAQEQLKSKIFLLDEDMIWNLLPFRSESCHKGEVGKVMVCAGSPGYTGAATLCALAAAKAGAGLVSLFSPLSNCSILSTKLTEVMVKGLTELEPGVLAPTVVEDILLAASQSEVLAIGPGLGVSKDTSAVIREVLRNLKTPVVIDADALTALVGHTDILRDMTASKILTPHLGELGRLLNMSTVDIDSNRVELASEYAVKWRSVLVIKGAPTVIGCPDGSVYINATGNKGMATGGSGDILTGVIAGLLAQGVTAENAALSGVYLHGLAGDLAAQKGMIGLVAGDILVEVPKARMIIENDF